MNVINMPLNKTISDKALFFSVALFVFSLFALDRNIATKVFYVLNIITVVYIVLYKSELMRVFRSRIVMAIAISLLYFIVNTALQGNLDFPVVKNGFRVLIFVVSLGLLMRSENVFDLIINIVVAATILGSFFDLYVYVSSGLMALNANFGVGTKYLWHIFAGGVYSIVAIMCVYKIITAGTIARKIIFSFALTYLLWLVILAQSRAAILALAVIALFSAIFMSRKYYKEFVVVCGISMAVVITMLFYGFPFESLVQRMDAGRFDIWGVSIDRIMEAPLFGNGINGVSIIEYNGGYVTEPHNLYLYVLLCGGIFGLTALLWIFYEVMLFLVKNCCSVESLLLLALLGFVIVFNFFDSRNIIDSVGVGWILFWMPIAMSVALQLRTLLPPLNIDAEASM